jgi:YgiT-type zinc finger domain-containing protein
MKKGRTTLTFERAQSIIIVRNVPAKVCDTCGNATLNVDTSIKAYNIANTAISKGKKFHVIDMMHPKKVALKNDIEQGLIDVRRIQAGEIEPKALKDILNNTPPENWE